MKKYLLLTMMGFGALNSSAQVIENVGSTDLGTGIIYPGNEVADTVIVDSIANAPIPQIPLEQCDSLTVSSPSDRYGVVWKDGERKDC